MTGESLDILNKLKVRLSERDDLEARARVLLSDLEELRAIHEALKASVEAAPKGEKRYRIVLEPWEGEWRATVNHDGTPRFGMLLSTNGTAAYVTAAIREEMEEYARLENRKGREAQAEEAPRGRPVEAGPGGDDEDNHCDIPATVKAIHGRIDGLIRRLDKLETRLNHRDKAYDRLHEMMAKFDHWPAGSPA